MILADKLRCIAGGQNYADIVFVGGKTSGANGVTTYVQYSLTNLTGGIDTKPSIGDLIVLVYSDSRNIDYDLSVGAIQTPFMSTPCTLTDLGQSYSNDTYDTNMGVYFGFFTSTPPSSFNIKATGSGTSQSMAVAVFRNVDPNMSAADFQALIVTGINGSLPTPPAITPNKPKTLVFCSASSSRSLSTVFSTTDTFEDFLTQDLTYLTTGIETVRTDTPFTPAQWSATGNSVSDSWSAVTLTIKPAQI